MMVGDTIQSQRFGKYKVTEKLPNGRHAIEFIDTGYKTTAQSTKVRVGNVKDYLVPCKFGVGFLGEMGGDTRVDKKPRDSYVVWHNMMVRCYDPNYHLLFPTYKDCEVCDEWKDYSKFHKWFESNSIKGYHLDKDSLLEGNKLYSPTTCVFLSPAENIVHSNKSKMKTWRILSPNGDETLVYNVSEFCRKEGLSQANFSFMLRGKRNHVGGWTKIGEVL